MLEGLIEYAKAKFGPTFSQRVYIFPVLRPQNKSSTFDVKKNSGEGGVHTAKVHEK